MKHAVKRSRPRVVLGLMLATAAVIALRMAAADTPETASAAPTSATQIAVSKVSISKFSFQPAVVVVKAGTKVIWTNHDNVPHTVTSSDRRFASSSGLDTNDRYSYVFDKPGTYGYFCSLHPMMVGKVIVQPAG